MSEPRVIRPVPDPRQRQAWRRQLKKLRDQQERRSKRDRDQRAPGTGDVQARGE